MLDPRRVWSLVRAPMVLRMLVWSLGAALVVMLTMTLPLPVEHAFGGSAHRPLVVADLRGHALVLFDPNAPAAARRIPLPGGPHELVELPDGRVVASLEQAGALAVVDPRSGEVSEVPTGGRPHGLAFADGVLYVSDRERDAVRSFDIVTWAELDSLPGGHWPHAVVATPDGVAVANAGDSTLTLSRSSRSSSADAGAAKPAAVLRTSALPETIASAADGRIATAGALGDRVDVFDRDGARVFQREVGGRPVRVGFSANGRTIAAALSASREVAFIDNGGDARHVTVGGMPDGLFFDPSSGLWFVSDLTAPRVTVVDPVRGRVEAVYDFEGMSSGAIIQLSTRGEVGGLSCRVVRQ